MEREYQISMSPFWMCNIMHQLLKADDIRLLKCNGFLTFILPLLSPFSEPRLPPSTAKP